VLACRSQVLAMSTGACLRPMGAIEVAELTGGSDHAQQADEEARRHFAAMRELVDAADVAAGRRCAPPLSVAG
jgi:hypothetical protein